MPLPDVSRLAAVPSARLHALGKQLASIGLTAESMPPELNAAGTLPPHLRRPAHVFYARRVGGPVGAAARMFLHQDPVTAEEATSALGDLAEELLDAGLLVRDEEGRVVSPFLLGVMKDLYILSDKLTAWGERDAVMGFGDTTITLCRASFPSRPIRGALDLGCGAGTAAIVLARAAKQVVGTDINPRALAIARVNAALNGVENIDFREGDLFAPVRGETFDLVVSQPPFIPRPEGATASTFLYGGPHGDEIALKLIAGLAPHLAGRGRAVLLVEWPDHGEEPLDERIRAASDPGLGLLVLEAPAIPADHHAVAYAAGLHPEQGEAFERAALERLAHVQAMGIRAIRPTLTILERCPPGVACWTDTIRIESFGRIAPSSARIDKLVVARRLVLDRARMLAATLRVPDDTVFVQRQVGPGAEVPSTLGAVFAPAALSRPMDLTTETLMLVTAVHEAKTAREGIAAFAEVMGASLEEATERGVPGIEEALLYGLLELARPERR